jgi:hypothetical protein
METNGLASHLKGLRKSEVRSVVPPLGLATPFLYEKPVRLPGRPVTVACLPRGPQLDWIHEMFGGLIALVSVGDGAARYSRG